jgi:chromosome segregation ATPase
VEEPKRRNSIVEESVDLDSIREKFSNGVVHMTDFSDRIESVGHVVSPRESVKNKIERLRLEMEELERQMDGCTEDDLSESKKLMELWSKINKKVKFRGMISLGQLHDSLDDMTIDEGVLPPDITSLETRIRQLEKTLGEFQPDSSIQSQINQLQRHISLLSSDSAQLDQITSTIEQVNQRFEKSIALRRAVEMEVDINEDIKIHELYELAQKTQGIQQELPWILKRMESLNELHLHSAATVSIAEEMDDKLNKMAEDMDKWEKCLVELEKRVR